MSKLNEKIFFPSLHREGLGEGWIIKFSLTQRSRLNVVGCVLASMDLPEPGRPISRILYIIKHSRPISGNGQ